MMNLVRRLAEIMAKSQRQAYEEADRRRMPKFDSGQVQQAVTRLNEEYALVLISGKLREALLRILQRFDLSAVNLRDIPMTSALSAQKIASMTPSRVGGLRSCAEARRRAA